MNGAEEHTIARLGEAVAFVEANLGEPLTVARIARAAAWSPYHFHRTFSAVIGETVMEYVRHRRLTGAAVTLRKGEKPIIEVALDAGFDSQEAFTRAFRRRFKTTPGRFRGSAAEARRSFCPPLTPADIRRRLERKLGGQEMEPTFVSEPEFDVVGLSDRFTVETTEGIPALWDRFCSAWSAAGREFPAVSYGICYDEGEGGEGESPPFTYLAGFDAGGEPPDGLESRTVPANTYAVFTHVGPVFAIKETYQHIFGTWLPTSGYERAEGPDFERYDERFDAETMGGEVDIYVPVRKV